ncbi:hypothetical protein Tcan_11268 [Toxocara canis]|uniref:Uncharacterized protein n=1 Tax=Toxocara canis TaxID=6265 RepID=A0A0B2V3S0_TOXCA|nr:hypothetical protein Tcan_11268 [Toxocara canis]
MRVKLLTLLPLLIISTVSCFDEEQWSEQRSLAIGRGQFRPAKREAGLDEQQWFEELLKRPMAFRQIAFRPGKRSLALGRVNFRPGKRNVDVADEEIEQLMEHSMGKRSAAFGRVHFRPGKRSLALGRTGFRPGKRSLAFSQDGFRSGKQNAINQPTDPRPVDISGVLNDLSDLLEWYEAMLANCGKQ